MKTKTKDQNLFSPLMQKTRVVEPEGIQEREARLHQRKRGLPELKDGTCPEEETLP